MSDFSVTPLQAILRPSFLDLKQKRKKSWQEQYLTSERSERVRYCFCHSNIKFISSRHRVISSIYTVIYRSLHTLTIPVPATNNF